MRRVQVVEAKARFSALLAEVESGETVVITRHGKVVARLVPDAPRMASDLFAPCWPYAEEIDLVAPPDAPPEPMPGL
jgi:prevent-host-death family protein